MRKLAIIASWRELLADQYCRSLYSLIFLDVLMVTILELHTVSTWHKNQQVDGGHYEEEAEDIKNMRYQGHSKLSLMK